MTSCQLIDVDEPDDHNDFVDSACEIVRECDLIVESQYDIMNSKMLCIGVYNELTTDSWNTLFGFVCLLNF